ncbi:hypothetical protein RF11_14020 [Thelohanellus kitauei]|uniref:Uncharacterized protein n=1 Tax=Thelohanellus kitauei TaxID=669202 RepID=A0A0C2IBB3_THEKT|nr:hypothetical protein RF11_14020 [Thelohanellus kitauei]
MAFHIQHFIQSFLFLVVLAQLTFPGHSQSAKVSGGRSNFCGKEYSEPLLQAIKSPDIEPENPVKRKMFETYKCVTRKMREESISVHEESRMLRAGAECCAEIYYKEIYSPKCQKLSKKMKSCLDFALTLSEDVLTLGTSGSMGDQPIVGYGGISPLYDGYHPLHRVANPFFGGIHPIHAMMNPFFF